MTNMLLEAVSLGRLYQVKFSLDNGADVNIYDEKRQTPLIRACLMDDKLKRSRQNMVKMLLAKDDLDINFVDCTGKSAFMWACLISLEDIVKIFLEKCFHRINLYLGDGKGNTALHYACSQGNPNIVQDLVESYRKYGLEIDKRNHYGHTALLEAVLNRQVANAIILLEECNACLSVCDSEKLMSISEWTQYLQLEPLYPLINKRTGANFSYLQRCVKQDEHLTASTVPYLISEERVSPILGQTHPKGIESVLPTEQYPRAKSNSERLSFETDRSFSSRNSSPLNQKLNFRLDHTRPFLKDSSWVSGGQGERLSNNNIESNSFTPKKGGACSISLNGSNQQKFLSSPRSRNENAPQLFGNNASRQNNPGTTQNTYTQHSMLSRPEHVKPTLSAYPRENSQQRSRRSGLESITSIRSNEEMHNNYFQVYPENNLKKIPDEDTRTLPLLKKPSESEQSQQKSTKNISEMLGKMLELSLAYNSPSYRIYKKKAEFIHTNEVCEILEAIRQNVDLSEYRGRKGRRRSSKVDNPPALNRRTSTIERGGMLRRTSTVDKSKVPVILQRRESITGSPPTFGVQRRVSTTNRRNLEGQTEGDQHTTAQRKLSALAE